jgi:NADH-quinone oxidoreductase subunit A
LLGGDFAVSDSLSHTTPYWPLVVYAVAVLALVIFTLGLSYLLGQHHTDRATGEAYESGIISTGSARIRFSSHFYLVAMLFVIFDLEAVFILAWAITFKELGWPGYLAIVVFITILVAVLVYEWRIGALDFGPSGKKLLRAYHKIIKQDAASKKITNENQ